MPEALTRVTAFDADVMARAIYGEARGESWQGKVAVAWVIRNRMRDKRRWPNDLAGVCLQERQFSAWNDDDTNRIKLMSADLSDPVFRECMLAALAVIQGHEHDATEGALWYHADTIDAPWWTKDFIELRIGRQIFYREPG